MTYLPLVAPQRIIRALKRAGFFVHHQEGSHCIMKRLQDGRRVTIPVHPGSVNKGILVSILDQAGITVDELRDLL